MARRRKTQEEPLYDVICWDGTHRTKITRSGNDYIAVYYVKIGDGWAVLDMELDDDLDRLRAGCGIDT